jgi:hypothetical protein
MSTIEKIAPKQWAPYGQIERFERSAAIERLEQHSGCVGRTETESKPYQYRLTLGYV